MGKNAEVMRSLALPRVLALALGLALLAPAAASAAEQFAGLTDDGQLLYFRSDSPGNLQGAVSVTGLQTGETLLGISWVPSVGRLYGLGSTNRIYTINTITGAAIALTNIPFTPPLNGTTFAFGIDAQAQQARSYSSSSQNLRISTTNGQVAGVDAAYAYEASDAAAGSAPVLAALGYTVPTTGSAGTPALYALDAARGTLVTAPTSQAIVRTIGALGVEVSGQAGITFTGAIPTATGGTTTTGAGTTTGTPTGTSTATAPAYASISPGTGKTPRLYTVDLSTGAATPVNADDALSTIAYRSASTSGSNHPVISLTAFGEAPDDGVKPRVVLAASSAPRATTLRKSGLPFTVACNEACSVSGRLKVGKHSLEAVTGSILSTAGSVKLTVKLDAIAKSALKKDPTQGLSLKVTATDAAGNARVVTAGGASR
jgi:hypothetical protein